MGHKNPDTDAICSAIAYADLLRQTRLPGAVAACCGTPNSRTEWVLSQAGLPRPRLVADVRPRAIDVCHREVTKATLSDTIFDAYHRMAGAGFRSLPVVEPGDRIVGMLSLLDLLQLLIPTEIEGEAVRAVRTNIASIAKVLGAGIACQPEDDDDAEVEYIMMVAGSSEPVMAERIASFDAGRLLIITGDRAGVQLLAVEAGVKCLVITSGFRPAEAILAAARAKGVTILMTPRDTASSTQLIRGSRPIQQAVSTEYASFDPDVPLHLLRDRIQGLQQTLFPVIEPGSRKLIGVFSRTDLVTPRRPKLILVDHNEFSQAVTGAEEAEIVEVMDHHRLSGNLVTREPVQFINKPVGSTCTIVARAFRSHGVDPSPAIATCLCAGIVSDTLNLTSPTATDEDRQVLAWLSETAGIDVNRFTEEFFAAGSVLRSSAPEAVIGSDRKEYEEGGYKVSISQVEEVGLNQFWPVRESLQAELGRLIEVHSLDIACLMVTDVNRNDSLLLIEAPEEVLRKIQFPRKKENLYRLDGVVSRKKQLFPWLSSVLGELGRDSG
ncbi:MAG: putative manganese-dependent inorganic diphosphatase [Verrucomicrobiae bacterium]|nr:putative manganese-dependent inorganic diphosphatase [Verrucomicrobiae bacterium]MCP5541437.1 putative manganese-dependent inorganic diphosphatase [Akkermansiaceae bacterium]